MPKVLIVDDEPLSRELMSKYVANHPQLVLTEVARNGRQAIERIVGEPPDVLLLDIEMPGLDGFGVLAEIERRNLPCPSVIFVTAYERYAVRAFEIHAVDYLLKPVSEERFAQAIERCLGREADSGPRLRSVLEDALYSPPRRLLVRDRGRIIPVAVEDIDWIEASDDYVVVHVGSQDHLLERSLAEMERLLAPRGFARVHRGAVVNLAQVIELRSLGSGRYELELQNGASLVVSRSYSHQFRGQLL